MSTVREGESCKGLCHECGLTTATYEFRDIPIKGTSRSINNILACVCDTCSKVIAIPQQSVPSIKTECAKK